MNEEYGVMSLETYDISFLTEEGKKEYKGLDRGLYTSLKSSCLYDIPILLALSMTWIRQEMDPWWYED